MGAHIGLAAGFALMLAVFLPVVSGVELASTTHIDCKNAICQATIYSYERYWYNESSGRWQEIDESFRDCGEGLYCTHDYHYQAGVDDQARITARIRDGRAMTYRIEEIRGERSFDRRAAVEGSVITYRLTDGIQLVYQYLTYGLKESLIIRNPIAAAPRDRKDFNVTFRLEEMEGFRFLPSIACDQRVCTQLNTTVTRDTINITIPGSWFWDSSRVFPVEIDPTIALNDSNISWDGYVIVDVDDNTIARNGATNSLFVGHTRTVFPAAGESNSTSIIEWDVSAFPENANITSMNLSLYIITQGNNGNENVSFYRMELNNSQYDNNNNGNKKFFQDASNGTRFTSAYAGVTGSRFEVNLTQGSPDFLDRVTGGYGWWGVGMSAEKNQSTADLYRFASADHATPAFRPYMNITYTLPPSPPADREVRPIDPAYYILYYVLVPLGLVFAALAASIYINKPNRMGG